MVDLPQVVIDSIIAAEYATTKDVDIFKDNLLDEPDEAIAVFEYLGSPQAWYCEMTSRSIQIQVRSQSTTRAITKAQQLYTLFYTAGGIATLQGHKCIINMRCTPFKLDRDSKGRVVYGFNMGILIN